jgi:hypothetical protein
MISKLWNTFAPSTQKLYPDDIPEILGYQERMRRTDPMNERFTESSAGEPSGLVLSLWVERDGPLKFSTIEIGCRMPHGM